MLRKSVRMAANEVKKVVEERGYKRIIIHLPAGLMQYWKEFSKCAEEVFFIADPCFGGCDINLSYKEAIKADAIFNIGHSKPLFLRLPNYLHFVELQLDFKPSFIPPCKRIGLVYVSQYRKAALRYAEKLRKVGKEVVIGKKPGFMAKHAGQITGCDVEAARKIKGNVDCFVVCADGKFHAQAVAMLGKKTYNWLGEEIKPKNYTLAKLFFAKRIGILVSVKLGQFNLELAKKLKEKLEEMGKEVLIVVGDTISKSIENYSVDLWISTACPRIAEDFEGLPAALVLEFLTEK